MSIVTRPMAPLALALKPVPLLLAEAHCPGNAASLRFQSNTRSLISFTSSPGSRRSAEGL